MIDIDKYLAGGDFLVKKRLPNPAVLPFPQRGMPEEFTAPVPEDVAKTFMPTQQQDEVTSRDKFAAVLGGIQKMFQNAPPPPPMQMPQMPIIVQAERVPRVLPLPKYGDGGYLPPGRVGIVGDKKQKEVAVALPQGGVQVIPIPDGMSYEDVSRIYPDGGASLRGGQAPLPQPDGGSTGEIPLPQTPIMTEIGQRPMIPTMTAAPPNSPKPDVQAILNQQIPSSVADAFKQNPALSDREQAYADVEKYSKPEKTNPWLNGLFVALQGIEKIFTPNNKPIQSLGEVRQAEKLGRAEARIARVEARRKAQQDYEYNKARTATIPIDDENKRLEIESRQTVAAQRAKDVALGQLNRLKHYDPNNVAHKRLAERAGIDPEELTGWDDRNPYTKTVAGITYVYDRTDQTFKPSNIPADESATLTDYKVKMPNGEFQTFKVAQKDAARFATQMQVLGAQIEAAERRQANQQEHDLRKQRIAFELNKALKDHDAAIKAGQAAEAEESKKRVLKYQQELQGFIDPE